MLCCKLNHLSTCYTKWWGGKVSKISDSTAVTRRAVVVVVSVEEEEGENKDNENNEDNDEKEDQEDENKNEDNDLARKQEKGNEV